MRNLILLAVSLVFGFNVNAATVNRAPYVTAAVSNSVTSGGPAVTAYVAPSNGYAIVQVNMKNTGSIICAIKIGTQYVTSPPPGSVSYMTTGLYVGPSQTIQVQNDSGTNVCTMAVSGVQFVNQ
jgi:hypothetical protein